MTRLLAFLSMLLAASPLCAQEIIFQGGEVENVQKKEYATRWGLSYVQGLGEHSMLSISYLNEGHLPNHHRDGYTPQFWLRTNKIGRRLSLAAGIGPYGYFDTNGARRSESFDAHGWAGIFSLAATWYTDSRFLFQLRANWIEAIHSFNSLSLTAGIGFQFDKSPVDGPLAKAPPQDELTTVNELTLFGGRAALNRSQSVHTTAEALEYRRGLSDYFDWTIGLMNEGPKRDLERYGFASQIWLVREFLRDHVALGIGVGPYYTYDRYHGATGSTGLNGLLGLTGSYRFSRYWAMRFTWNRVGTTYDKDTDVFLLGLTYRF